MMLTQAGARPRPAAPGGAAHLDVGGGVVSTCGDGVPLLANGLRLGTGPVELVDTRVPPLTEPPAPAASEHRLDQLLSIGGSRRGRAGLHALLGGIEARDPAIVRTAARALTGYGPGLTPEGDDALCGAALALAAAGPGCALDARRQAELARATLAPDIMAATTPLSVTLLRLASAGAGPEPLARLAVGDASARAQMERLGTTSGRALLATFDAAIRALSRGRPRSRARDRARSAASHSARPRSPAAARRRRTREWP